MTGTFLLALALAQAAQPTQTTQPVVLWTSVWQPATGEQAGPMMSIPDWRRSASALYFVANPTACNAEVTNNKPNAATNGWIVEVGPDSTGNGPRVTWSRISTSRPGRDRGSVPLSKSSPVRVLDKINAPPVAGGDCAATTWSLHARMGTAPRANDAGNVLEAELWFVHKAPDGKETTQRQVVRIREDGQAQFYFDDLELQTRWMEQDIKLTVEVYGGFLATKPENGKVEMLFGLTRRYLTKQYLIGKWPKSGHANMPITVTVGEVLSFTLPPLEDDAGVFLGHRFSVRMRIKPLGPDQN